MSLKAALRAGLRNFENLIENKHMNDTNHHQTSTPDADFCGELRTMSGLEKRISGQWKPIDTAPRDGSEIIVSGLDDGKGPTRHTLIAKWCKGEGMLSDHFTDGSGSIHLCHLTHWMPLPPSPDQPAPAPSERPTPTVYENRGGEVWERHADGRRELFAADIIARLEGLERELAEARENLTIERERADDSGLKWKQATEALAEARTVTAEIRRIDSEGRMEIVSCPRTFVGARGPLESFIERHNGLIDVIHRASQRADR